MRGMIRHPGGACLLAMVLTGGCAAPLNESTGLTGVDLAALSPPQPGLSGTDEPSLQGLDRSHWRVVRVRVPTDQVEHYPTFVQFAQVGPPGDYPTAVSALEVTDGLPDEIRQALRQPALAALAAVWWPVELASGNGPWHAQRSERFDFAREVPDRPEPPWSWVASPTP
ncbi:MAG: hypothetical protein ACYS0D_02275 [Planctomycetota bacterium]